MKQARIYVGQARPWRVHGWTHWGRVRGRRSVRRKLIGSAIVSIVIQKQRQPKTEEVA